MRFSRKPRPAASSTSAPTMIGLADALNAGQVTGYIGFDATADSLHVGSLVSDHAAAAAAEAMATGRLF